MVHIVMVRHGQPDYSYFQHKDLYKGFGLEFGPLTAKGIEQAKKASFDERLQGAELIVSSPFTRSLQTAYFISKTTGLDIEIAPQLHEWIPKVPYDCEKDEDYVQPNLDFIRFKGQMNDAMDYQYETLQQVFDRCYQGLLPYQNYRKIIVVAHELVMRAFKYEENIDYCHIIEFDFDEKRSLKDNGQTI